MRKYISLTLLFMSLSALLSAQEPVFKIVVPDNVVVGDSFMLEYHYEIDGTAVPDRFIAPDFDEDIDVMAGPVIQTQKSCIIKNGETSYVTKCVYSYILVLHSEKVYTIGIAAVETEDGILESEAFEISAKSGIELPEL